MLFKSCIYERTIMFQVTLSIELNDSQVGEFERLIPVQLAQPPWNYPRPLDEGIMVRCSFMTDRKHVVTANTIIDK